MSELRPTSTSAGKRPFVSFFQKIQTLPVACFLFTFLLFSLGAAGTEITKIDIRFALMVEDMAVHGIGVFPTVNGVAYADYPSTWLVFSLLTTLWGTCVNLWTLSLPTILVGAYCVSMTLAIGEKIQKGAGIAAAGLTFLSWGYLNMFLGVSLDAVVIAATVTMFWLIQRETPLPRLLIYFAFLLIVSFFVRGPLGFLLLSAAVGGYFLGMREWKRCFQFGFTGLFTGVLCVAAGYSLIHLQGGNALWEIFHEWQINSRMKGFDDVLYYFASGAPSFAPVPIVAAVVLLFHWKKLPPTFYGYTAALLLPMLLLSVPSTKHLRYMGLTFPLFALIGGWGLMNASSYFWHKVVMLFLKFADKLFPFVFLPALGIVIIVGVCIDQPVHLPWGHWGLTAVLFVCFLFLFRKCGCFFSELTRIAMLAFLFCALGAFPFSASLENSAPFVEAVELNRKGALFFYRPDPDHDDLKYVFNTAPSRRSEIVYLYDKPQKAATVLERMYPGAVFKEKIGKITPHDVIIVRDRYLAALEKNVLEYGLKIERILSGHLGHRDFLAVRLFPVIQK